MQIPVLLLAAWMIFDGLVGPQLAPKNLATVGTWLHYRGLTVLALLLAGNLFCMACPFMLTRARRPMAPRTLAEGRPSVSPGLSEQMACHWARRCFLLRIRVLRALVHAMVDGLGGARLLRDRLCGRYSLPRCVVLQARLPAGAVQLLRVPFLAAGNQGSPAAGLRGLSNEGLHYSLGQPLPPTPFPNRQSGEGESSSSLARPAGRERGSRGERSYARGCELNLFQQRKVGNMDCTFCLDCTHACPSDNIGIVARTPTRELWTEPWRSGIGRFSQRWDLAALVVVFTFGAFLNAFNMIKPVYGLQTALAQALRTTSRAPGLALIFVLGLVILPAALLSGAGWLTRRQLTGVGVGVVILRYVWSLAPMGFGMWLAHYGFHFLTGGATIVPVMQSFLADVGLFDGRVRWDLGPLAPQTWLFPIEAALLYLGATASIVVAVQIANNDPARTGQAPSRALAAAIPWIAVTLLMLGFGIWIMLQPMEMRGTLMMASPQG